MGVTFDLPPLSTNGLRVFEGSGSVEDVVIVPDSPQTATVL